jgi:hypothetical protein
MGSTAVVGGDRGSAPATDAGIAARLRREIISRRARIGGMGQGYVRLPLNARRDRTAPTAERVGDLQRSVHPNSRPIRRHARVEAAYRRPPRGQRLRRHHHESPRVRLSPRGSPRPPDRRHPQCTTRDPPRRHGGRPVVAVEGGRVSTQHPRHSDSGRWLHSDIGVQQLWIGNWR